MHPVGLFLCLYEHNTVVSEGTADQCCKDIIKLVSKWLLSFFYHIRVLSEESHSYQRIFNMDLVLGIISEGVEIGKTEYR